MTDAKKHGVGKAAALLMAGTILSKALGLLRELSVAYRFGAGPVSDAFVLTNGIPTMIFSAVGVAIGINYIPCVTRISRQEEQNRFTSNLLNLLLAVLIIGCIIVCIIPQIVLKIFASGLGGETEQYAIVMLRIVVFSIIPIVLIYLFQAYNQAKGEFATTAIQGVVINIIVIGFTYFSTDRTFYLLSIGTIMANTAGMILLFISSRKNGFRYQRIFQPRDREIRNLALLTLPLLVENIASNLSLLVDRNLASYLDSGTISALSYAGNLGDIAGTMIASAIITATFPMFSKLLADNDKETFCIQFEKYAASISYLLAPISLFMIANSNDIVAFIFEHGAFNNTATKIVSESMICYAVGVLPMGLQSYLIRGFYAMQDTKTPVKIKVLALVCNIVLNLVSVRFIRHMGIALSTSVSYIIAYSLLTRALKTKHEVTNVGRITKEGIMSLLLSIIPGMILFLVFNRVFIIDNLLFKLLTEGVLFVGFYGLMMVLFKRDVLKGMTKMIMRK